MCKTILLDNGDMLDYSEKSAIIRFTKPRKVLSTSANNGGLRKDLTAIFNYNDCGFAGVCEPMQGDNFMEHQRTIAERLGLNPDYTAGLNTAVNLDNLVYQSIQYEHLSVTAIVSGGADINAVCAGDPSYLHERTGEICSVPSGTINIILLINQTLSDGAMAEAMMTATEAKSSVLRDLMQGSCYSSRLATGTGTDGVIVVCDSTDDTPLYNAGKHFKLGEIIGKIVRETVTEALFRQTGFGVQSQHNALQRLRRFGITEESILEKCAREMPNERKACHKRLLRMEKDGFLVAAASLYVHLADQVSANMLTVQESLEWGEGILASIRKHYCCPIPETRLMPNPEKFMTQIEDLFCEVILLHIKEEKRLYQ